MATGPVRLVVGQPAQRPSYAAAQPPDRDVASALPASADAYRQGCTLWAMIGVHATEDHPAGDEETSPVLEILHEAQEQNGHLREADIAGAARKAGTSAAELYGAISAYPRFRLEPGTTATLVCTSPACLMAGASAALRGITDSAETHCLGLCDQPVAVLTPDGARIWEDGKLALPAGSEPIVAGAESAFFGSDDPMAVAHDALARDPEEAISAVTDSGLEGRGGAGFPAGRKWRTVRDAAGRRKYVVCNLDESEPGTFKDRAILRSQPGRILAGMIIAAHAVGASHGVVYIRYEYEAQRQRLLAEIEHLRADGLLGNGFDIVVRRAAGLYVCGEETALLNSLEGKRPVPRDRPPYPAGHGLYGRPTLIQNAETLAAVPSIIGRGAAWFRDAGMPKLYCISGDIPEPGVFELPMTVTAGDLVERGGGTRANVKAFTLGGLSGGLLPAEALDVRLDFEDPRRYDAALGSGGVTVLGSSRCVVRFALGAMRFFAGESCGKCFPCRIGTIRLREQLEAATAFQKTDETEMRDVIDLLQTGSACGLGPAAGLLARHLTAGFGDEVGAHYKEECPAGECANA
jgi:NADH:ubiquinone oxidoreductase subunit F (NADH-binding)